MKTTKPVVILLALVFLIAAGAQSAEKSAKKEISNTRTASCLFKITTSEAVLPLNNFAVEYLLYSSGVAGKAAREILDISPDIVSELFEIEEVFAVDSTLGGYGGGGYGGMGGGYGGGGYGGGTGGMGLPADSMPGASTYGTTTTSPSTRRTSPTAARITSRTPTAPAPSSTRRPTIPSRAPTWPPPRRTPTVTQPPLSAIEETILFHLRVDFSQADNAEDIKPAAEEFMVAVIENLRSALREAFDQYSAKLNQQLKLADKEAIQAEQQLILMQRELRDISGSRDLSRHAILSDIRSVRQKLQSAMMKRASDETIHEATVKQIAQEQARRKKLIENDPITKEFLSILDVHEKRLENVQNRYKLGEVSIADVEDVREKIIRARIDLAKRQEEVSNPPGGIVISSLNDELANLATNMALAKQEIRSFEQQLEEAKDLLKNTDNYELLSLKAGIAKQSLEETLLWRARLGRNNRSIQPPDITVIGAE